MSDAIEAHLIEKFEIVRRLGKGAYGIVWQAIKRQDEKVVALKKVFDAFHNKTDAQRTFREVMILQALNKHPNIIKLLNIVRAKNNKDLYLVFDYMETDLHAVIRANILIDQHQRWIIYQILRSLKFIHSGEIIHRDLKPSNILINKDCQIKIADFGQARSINGQTDEESDVILTEYIATRWYRAPEIVLGSQKYTKSVDVWSVGCILGEMIHGKAIFPGKSTLNQIELIIKLIGPLSNNETNNMESQMAWNIQKSLNVKEGKSFTEFFPNATPDSIDFMKKCQYFDPNDRITIDEALEHPYVSEFRNSKTEMVLKNPVKLVIDDNEKLTIKDYRDALYKEIANKKKKQVINSLKKSCMMFKKNDKNGKATMVKGTKKVQESMY